MQNPRSSAPSTKVTVRFAGDFYSRVDKASYELDFVGHTLRQLIDLVMEKFDLQDLFMHDGRIRPYLQIVIDGRLAYTVGGMDAHIHTGATVTFFVFRGALHPVPLPKGSTLRELREGSAAKDRDPG
jgi:molybdopterin converting factor small subunit